MKNTLTKIDIINSLKKDLPNLKYRQIVLIVSSFFLQINKILLEDRILKFKNFGKFTINKKKNIFARDIYAKKQIKIINKEYIKFQASDKLKFLINI